MRRGADLPIYIAALSPNMLRLAGEIGDGVMLWLCNPDYIRDVVIPAVDEGRERAGKTMDGFDVVAAVPVGLTDDPEGGPATQRNELVPYASLPFYRAMLERSGFGDELAAFDEGMRPETWSGRRRDSRIGCSRRWRDRLGRRGPRRRRALPGRRRHLAVHRRDPRHGLRRRRSTRSPSSI